MASDAARLSSEAEKLADGKINVEQNPVLLAAAADTAHMGFYPFTVPQVDGAMLETLIVTQAEMIIPTPLAQVAFTWRIIRRESGTQHGFLAAVRKGYFQELSRLAGGGVGSILPDATGLVAAWSSVFDSTPHVSVLIQVRNHCCVLALCDQEKLVRATAIDFDAVGGTHALLHDLLTVVDELDVTKTAGLYLTGQTNTVAALCGELTAAGKSAQLWALSESKVSALGAQNYQSQLCSQPEAFGIAIAALGEDCPEFDFVRRPRALTSSAITIDKRGLVRSLAMVAVMILLFYAVKYWAANSQLQQIRQALSAEHQATTGQKILARQQMRERIVKSRPDMLEVFMALSKSAEKDITLDTFNFKKGQPIRITARAQSFEQVYQFQKKLQEQAGVRDVKLISPTNDERKKQVQFTMTFMYKNFSK
ncbi:MAG: hypothetical protein C0394_08885 [Syntrophus sp. (in: bacteria)]|nr:hypothetical protein [Syntrophus sp. (in: bacteria)]